VWIQFAVLPRVPLILLRLVADVEVIYHCRAAAGILRGASTRMTVSPCLKSSLRPSGSVDQWRTLFQRPSSFITQMYVSLYNIYFLLSVVLRVWWINVLSGILRPLISCVNSPLCCQPELDVSVFFTNSLQTIKSYVLYVCVCSRAKPKVLLIRNWSNLMEMCDEAYKSLDFGDLRLWPLTLRAPIDGLCSLLRWDTV